MVFGDRSEPAEWLHRLWRRRRGSALTEESLQARSVPLTPEQVAERRAQAERILRGNRIDVTAVKPGQLEEMRAADAGPSPSFRAAIERRSRRLE